MTNGRTKALEVRHGVCSHAGGIVIWVTVIFRIGQHNLSLEYFVPGVWHSLSYFKIP